METESLYCGWSRLKTGCSSILKTSFAEFKLIVTIAFFLLFNVFLNHLFGYSSNRSTEIPTSPKMLAPVAFMQRWELILKQTGTAPLKLLNNLSWSHCWWAWKQKVQVVFGYIASHYCNAPSPTTLFYQLTKAMRYRSAKYFVTILRHPNDVIFDIVNSMRAGAVVHSRKMDVFGNSSNAESWPTESRWF